MIPTNENVKTITDMRERARELLEETKKSSGPLYIFYRSKPAGVLLSIESYVRLADLLEDYLDSLEAREFEKMDKNKEEWVSLKEVAKSYGVKFTS